MNAARKPLTAVIADDERLLREQLKTRLAVAWPELQIAGEARDGNEALAKADELRPDVVFLDIRMPGMTGIEAAREILALPDWHGEIVFVTAYDEYAVAAFEQGAIDFCAASSFASKASSAASSVAAPSPPGPGRFACNRAFTRCAVCASRPASTGLRR